MADYQPHTDHGTQPPPHVNGSAKQFMPEHLMAMWDALPAELHDRINGPWTGRNLNKRKLTKDCLRALRDRGWTLEQCLELAECWAWDGLGQNMHRKTLFPELWR